MVTYRVPSVTDSIDSDAPIPNTLEGDPLDLKVTRGTVAGQSLEVSPKAKKEVWTLFLGNLHPFVKEKDIFNLFKRFLGNDDEGIKSITIRTTRGCAVANIPQEVITKEDRSYATVQFAQFAAAEKALKCYRRKSPNLHGLEVTVANNPADLPDRKAIMRRVLQPKTKTQPTGKRIAAEKTELMVEEQQRPLAGPCRRAFQPRPRYNEGD